MNNKKIIRVLMIIFDLVLVRNSVIVTCDKLSIILDPKPTSHVENKQVKLIAPKIKYSDQPMDRFQLRSLDGREHHRYFTDLYDYKNDYNTERTQKIVAHLPKTTTDSSFDFFGEDEDKNEEYDDDDEEDDYGKYEEEDKEVTDYVDDEGKNQNADVNVEDKKRRVILRRLRRRHEVHELIFPLLLAYKLKFFIMLPLLVGALVLLIGTTSVAGFFFALFSAALGLRGKTH